MKMIIMNDEIDIKIGKSIDRVTTVTTVTTVTATEEKQKNRFSRKFKCPRCGDHPLEIYNLIDKNDKLICEVYVCHKCERTPGIHACFWTKEECDKI